MESFLFVATTIVFSALSLTFLPSNCEDIKPIWLFSISCSTHALIVRRSWNHLIFVFRDLRHVTCPSFTARTLELTSCKNRRYTAWQSFITQCQLTVILLLPHWPKFLQFTRITIVANNSYFCTHDLCFLLFLFLFCILIYSCYLFLFIIR